MLAEVFRRFAPAYLERHGPTMPPSHLKAISAIMHCRTHAYGAEQYQCPDCGEEHLACHSCNHRACPRCGGDKTDQWLRAQIGKLLPCPYFMMTFTVPGQLRQIFRSNQRLCYNLLFASAKAAILKLAADPKHLGALPGLIAMLHTWTRQLDYHPHVHLMVTAGGLRPDGSWQPAKYADYFLPYEALSLIYRAKFRDALKRSDPALFRSVPAEVWEMHWSVNCQAKDNGLNGLKYLARYSYQTAIKDNQIIDCDQQNVTFQYRHRKSGQIHTRCMPGQAFLQRFLQHVLPHNFTRIRHYGLFAPANRPKLQQARKQFNPRAHAAIVRMLASIKPRPKHTPRCQHCERPMQWIRSFRSLGQLARAPPFPSSRQ